MFNILIVEDDKNTRRLMEAVIRENGFRSFLAADGSLALDILENNHIDLIILDIMMPNMDGYSLTEELRDSGYNILYLW